MSNTFHENRRIQHICSGQDKPTIFISWWVWRGRTTCVTAQKLKKWIIISSHTAKKINLCCRWAQFCLPEVEHKLWDTYCSTLLAYNQVHMWARQFMITTLRLLPVTQTIRCSPRQKKESKTWSNHLHSNSHWLYHIQFKGFWK